MAGALREILAKFGFDVDTSKLDDAKGKTDGLVDGLKTLAATIAGKRIVDGIKNFVTDLQEQAGQLRTTSQQLGISTEDLQRWQAAAKLAGVSNEGLATGFKFLQKNAADAASSGGDAAAEFKKLGVDIKDSSGQIKPASQLMRETGLAIGGMKNPTERTATALKLLGRGGLELIPLFNKGEEGLDGFLKRLDELGGGLNDKALKNLGAYSRSTKEFDFAVLGVKSSLAVELIPKLTDLMVWITKGVLNFAKLTKGSNLFTAAVTVLGTAAALAAVKMYLPYLPIIALFAGLVLLVDEVITLFQGGDTLIGSAIDKLFGAGAAARMVDTLTKAFQGFRAEGLAVPGIIAAIAAAFLVANAPLAAFAASIAAITAAFVEFKKLKEEWDPGLLLKKLKQDLVGERGTALEADIAGRRAYEENQQRIKTGQSGASGQLLNSNGAPVTQAQIYDDALKRKEARLTIQEGLANIPWTGMVPGSPTIQTPPPLLARPPEPVISKKEIKVTTQSDTKVTFSGPSPDKADVTKGLADSGKALQAAVLATLEGQK